MQSGRVHKYRAVTLLIHKLRTDLFGMQKALMERVRDDLHVEVMQKNTFKMKNNQVDDDSIQEFQEGIRHLMFTSLRTLRSVVLYVAGDQEKEWSGQVARQSKEKMKKNIQTDISELKVLELALERFHHDYSQLRRELSTRPDEDRIERDKWLNVFLFNLTSYSQALMDFPSDYATGLEQAQSDKHIFLPESKMVVLSFQKRQLISAGKTAAAITSAAFINMRFKFNNQQLSPVLIAYVMGGHVGGSWANTANRVLGLIVGMIMAFFFTIFSECNSYALGAGFAVVITLSFYVRDASRSHSYAGAVAAFVECLIMVGPCETETTLQLDMVEQIVLSCLLISVAEIFMASSSDLFFRKQVADTLLDCLSVFKEVFDAHVSVNLESLTMRTKKDVDAALWRNLPGSLHKQEEFLAQSVMEPALWAAEAPHSAYQKLIYSGRRLNLHLILLHRAFVRMDVLRHNTEHVDAFREQKLLLDDLVVDEENRGAANEVIELRNQIQECFEELSGSIRSNYVRDKGIDWGGENPDEIDSHTRNEMENLDTVTEGYEDWWISKHPTGSTEFKKLADAAQSVMYRVYSTQHDARSPLRKQMSSLSSSFVERSAETIKLRNDDLMSYHAIAVSLREFVEALLEADKLVWGGDAGWINMQFQ